MQCARGPLCSVHHDALKTSGGAGPALNPEEAADSAEELDLLDGDGRFAFLLGVPGTFSVVRLASLLSLLASPLSFPFPFSTAPSSPAISDASRPTKCSVASFSLISDTTLSSSSSSRPNSSCSSRSRTGSG